MAFTAKEAANIMIEDVMRRRKQFGLTGEGFKFMLVTTENGAPAVFFTTSSGEDIGGYGFFTDEAHRAAAVEILTALMADMDRVMVVKTNGGMTLRANVWAVMTEGDNMRAEWDMRHNLIHNPKFPYAVRGADVESVQYVKG